MTPTGKLIAAMVEQARLSDQYARSAILARVDILIDLYIKERTDDK